MKLHRPCKAFTLIEMAIVLIIIGILVGLIAPIVTDVVKREKTGNARDYVEQVRDEIVGFALINKRLPTAAELGTKIDVFGNTLIYHPSTEMTAQDFCSINPGDLYTVTEQLAPSGTNTYSGIAFIIASPGRDLTQQFTVAGTAVGTYDPRAWTPIAGQDEYDDIVEFVSFNYLKNKVCTNNSGNATPPGSQISFVTDPGAFSTANSPTTTNAAGNPFVSFNAETGTLTFDTEGSVSDQAACNFYAGNLAGNCTNGLCLMREGIRVYYKFTAATGSNGGFTFALVGVNSTVGHVSNCPDTPAGTDPGDPLADCTDTTNLCGGECGYNGYADQIGTNVGLDEPKMGIEYDFYRSNNGNYNDDVFGTSVSQALSNHMAILHWATAATNVDDVNHDLAVAGASDYENPHGTGTFYAPATNGWMEDGVPHTARVEVHRFTNNSTWEIYAWFDCTNCTDLSVDYNASNPSYAYMGMASNNSTIPNGALAPNGGPVPLFDNLNYFRFGWTAGICGTQTVNITDFGLAFR